MAAKVTFIFQGGLGNQLFQLSRALSVEFQNVDIATHFYSHRKSTPRTLALDELLAKLEGFAKAEKMSSQIQIRLWIGRKLRKMQIPKSLILMFLGIDFEFSDESSKRLCCFRNSMIYEGYWQRYKYVCEAEKVLLPKLLSFVGSKRVLLPENLPHTPKLVLHIRGTDRHDLKSSKGIKDFLHSQTFDDLLHRYEVSSAVNPLIVLTDDQALGEGILENFNDKIIFGPERATELQALKIMTNAECVVVGNSSFAWWGSYLCKKKGGKVVLLPSDKKYPDHFVKLSESNC